MSMITTSAPKPAATFAALVPTTPPPSTTTCAGATPGTPPNKIPRPIIGFSRDFAHRCQQRQCALLVFDRLVRDRDDLGFHTALRQFLVRSEMEVSEDDLPR